MVRLGEIGSTENINCQINQMYIFISCLKSSCTHSFYSQFPSSLEVRWTSLTPRVPCSNPPSGSYVNISCDGSVSCETKYALEDVSKVLSGVKSLPLGLNPQMSIKQSRNLLLWCVFK